MATNLNRDYYYRPINFFGGKLLKCNGHGAEDPKHLSFYGPYYAPQCYVLRGYHGDRITLEYAAQHAIKTFGVEE